MKLIFPRILYAREPSVRCTPNVGRYAGGTSAEFLLYGTASDFQSHVSRTLYLAVPHSQIKWSRDVDTDDDPQGTYLLENLIDRFLDTTAVRTRLLA